MLIKYKTYTYQLLRPERKTMIEDGVSSLAKQCYMIFMTNFGFVWN